MRVEPFGLGKRHRRGPERGEAVGVELQRSSVRFMKSSTPSPEAKRALRAVGSTWLEPAT